MESPISLARIPPRLEACWPFSPERAGAVPSGALIKMCYSGQYTEKEVYGKIVGKGGFNAYLGTNDMRVPA